MVRRDASSMTVVRSFVKLYTLPGPEQREKVVGGVITRRICLKQLAPGRRIRA